LWTPGHHTALFKNTMTYFQLQMNTVAVTFAQISFCSNLHYSYMLVISESLQTVSLPQCTLHTSTTFTEHTHDIPRVSIY
jgi:hypothetical protein